MNVLLDTHLVLWFAKGDERLPHDARPLLESTEHAFFVSEISVLEIAIKHAKNPAAMPYSAREFVRLCEDGGFTLRPLGLEAIFAYEDLHFDRVGDLHKDPFDRLLISQAKSEGMILATHDRLLALYGEPCVHVYV